MITLASLIVIGLVCGGFLVALDRRDQRERAERADLLQRIQDPEAAVQQHAIQLAPPTVPLPAVASQNIADMHSDDDDAYWRAHGYDGPTREELAEALARAEGV